MQMRKSQWAVPIGEDLQEINNCKERKNVSFPGMHPVTGYRKPSDQP